MINVKPSRAYDSSGRQARARQNRAVMLQAALETFLRVGYAATTLPQVATLAGVSSQTAYAVFRNKPALLKAVFDYAVAGDADPVPVLDRERTSLIRAEPDPRRKITMYVDGLHELLSRSARLQILARDTAQVDADVGAVWEKIQDERLIGMTRLAEHLNEGGHLAPALSVEEARDLLWTLTSPELYELLVLRRGWTRPLYCNWITKALTSLLLDQ
ncbi:MAG: TetR/AcrR family transcriptional regulator [Mycobacteriales bacterium]